MSGVVDSGGGRSRRVTPAGTAAALLALLVAVVCVRLGFWQLDRMEQRAELNTRLAAAAALPPLELSGDSFAAVRARPEAYLYRQVVVRGVFDLHGELVLRGRALGGRPGVNLITPLHLRGGEGVVLVNRGWSPSPDASTIDPAPLRESGTREIRGILQPGGSGEMKEIRIGTGRDTLRTVQRLDLERLRGAVGGPLLPLLVQQLPDTVAAAAPLTRLPLPEPEPGPHLSYAVQWFSFAAIALLGFLVAVFLSSRRRRGR